MTETEIEVARAAAAEALEKLHWRPAHPASVTMPMEPTEAMQQAGIEVIFSDSDLKRRDLLKMARKIYRAMLAAFIKEQTK